MGSFQVAGQRGVGPSVQLSELKFAGEAQGDVIFFDGTTWKLLTVGTTGQLLTTKGAAADPEWSSAGGSWTFLGSDELTTAGTTKLSVSFTATALTLFILFVGENEDAGGQRFRVQVNGETVSNYDSQNLNWGAPNIRTVTNASEFEGHNVNQNQALVTSGYIRCSVVSDQPEVFMSLFGKQGTGQNQTHIFTGNYDGTTTTSVDGIVCWLGNSAGSTNYQGKILVWSIAE